MMKIERPKCPQWLAENCEKWAKQWQAKRTNPNRKNDWQSYQLDGEKVNQKLLPLLIKLTKNHCSYCDKRPIGVETIDHFKPSAEFPLESYTWENLFISCQDCNKSKLNSYDKLFLKPDEFDYEFNNYFVYIIDSGELKPRGAKDSIEFIRATKTIEILKLNERGLPEARKFIFDKCFGSEDLEIDKVPYRFLLQENG